MAPVLAIAVGCGGIGQSEGVFGERAPVGGRAGHGNVGLPNQAGASADASTSMQAGGTSSLASGSPHAGVASTMAGGIAGSSPGGATGVAPPPNCSTSIDDMEDRSGRVGSRCNRIGVWYAFNANTEPFSVSGTQEPEPTQPGVPIAPAEIPGGRGESHFAMHTTGLSRSDLLLKGWWGGIGFDLAFDGQQYRAYDASGYDGLTFWVRGSASDWIQLRVSTVATTLKDYGGNCVCEPCNPHAAGVNLSSDWQQVWVPFDKLGQAGSEGNYQDFDPKAVTNIQFYCAIGCTSFDFWIDDVAFYNGEGKTCCQNPPPTCLGQVSLTNSILGEALGKSTLSSCEVCDQRSLYVHGSLAPSTKDLAGLGCYSSLDALQVEQWQNADFAAVSALQRLEKLKISRTLLTDAREFNRLPQLQDLDLSDNQMAESSGLGGNWGLTRLILTGNQLTELGHWGTMPRLVELKLDSNRIADLTGIGGLSVLTSLDLSRNSIKSLKPLAGLATLTTLNLSDNAIEDLTGIGELAALTALKLPNNAIRDLTPLAGLKSLTTLDLSNNAIKDLTPLAGLSSLRHLKLAKNQIVDLAPLANLGGLEVLHLSNNSIKTTVPLRALGNLKELLLDHNQVSDLGGLEGLTALGTLLQSSTLPTNGTLTLHDNAIADLRPLANLTRFGSLDLSRNQIVELIGLPSTVTTLALDDNKITELGPLAGLAALYRLSIRNNQVVDLSPLAGLALSSLDIENNQVSDISPIANGKLNTLMADGNRISDIGPMVPEPNLHTIDGYMASNPGTLEVRNNSIDCAQQAANIAALLARRVRVAVDCP